MKGGRREKRKVKRKNRENACQQKGSHSEEDKETSWREEDKKGEGKMHEAVDMVPRVSEREGVYKSQQHRI